VPTFITSRTGGLEGRPRGALRYQAGCNLPSAELGCSRRTLHAHVACVRRVSGYSSRCGEGSAVLDVMKVTHYAQASGRHRRETTAPNHPATAGSDGTNTLLYTLRERERADLLHSLSGRALELPLELPREGDRHMSSEGSGPGSPGLRARCSGGTEGREGEFEGRRLLPQAKA
jgi:hypothetical protein